MREREVFLRSHMACYVRGPWTELYDWSGDRGPVRLVR